jgi:nitroreductase
MNEIITSIFNRKSVRSYENRPISSTDKDLIFEAALQAPTAGNQVLYTILDIDDQKIKDTLAVTCDNQPFIAEAPLVLIFLADCRRWLDCYKYSGTEYRSPGLGDLLLACADALIAAQNAVTAAESLGIGSCYIGDILENYETHVKLLNLDKYVLPAAMAVFGYPTEHQKNRPKPKRFNKKYIIQKNTYTCMSEENLRSMFKEVNPESDFDFNKYIGAFCKRKYMSDFSHEMNRSAGEYLKLFGR